MNQIAAGSGINAAPVSYRLGGKQYVLVPSGLGGAMQFYHPTLHFGDNAKGPARLLAFSLDGAASLPAIENVERQVAQLPSIESALDTVEPGAWLYKDNCLGCHGKDAVARYAGSVPDLRYASAEIFETWHAIVIGGARKAQGMPGFELTVDEAIAIRNFVISEAQKIE